MASQLLLPAATEGRGRTGSGTDLPKGPTTTSETFHYSPLTELLTMTWCRTRCGECDGAARRTRRPARKALPVLQPKRLMGLHAAPEMDQRIVNW